MKQKPVGKDLVLNAIERERTRLGALLHETLCQTLAGISIQLDVMLGRARKGQRVAVSDLAELTTHIHEAIDTTRRISGDLRSTTLEGNSLMERLAELVDATSKVLPCEYICEKPAFVTDVNAGLALLRIAEEAVANVLAHAVARHVTISLTRSATAVTLKVRDDGKGFVPSETKKGSSGIAMMRRRARAVKAELKVESEVGCGTTISCRLRVGPALAGPH